MPIVEPCISRFNKGLDDDNGFSLYTIKIESECLPKKLEFLHEHLINNTNQNLVSNTVIYIQILKKFNFNFKQIPPSPIKPNQEFIWPKLFIHIKRK